MQSEQNTDLKMVEIFCKYIISSDAKRVKGYNAIYDIK
jgi:hypothetical protein